MRTCRRVVSDISCRGKDPFALRPTRRFEQQLQSHFGKKLGQSEPTAATARLSALQTFGPDVEPRARARLQPARRAGLARQSLPASDAVFACFP